jgi:hypothetical protein
MKVKPLKLMIGACILLLGGCTHSHYTPVPHAGLTAFNVDIEEVEHHLQLATNRLDLLVLLGAKACLPASIQITKMQLNSAQMALKGRLWTFAANAVILLDRQLQSIDKRLAYLKQNVACSVDSAHKLVADFGSIELDVSTTIT